MSCDYIKLAAPGVAELMPYQPGKPVEELERELGISDSIKLASNENPLGPSPLAIKTIRSELNGLALYPDGNGFALKQAIASRQNVLAEQITLGNGSNEILELVARTFLRVGDEVIFSAQAFAVYPIVTQSVGAVASIAAANSVDHPMPFGHDLDAMLDRINDKTRLIFVANPNNPTGTWLLQEALERFLQKVPEHVIVVVDEAYFEYVTLDDYPDTMQWVSRFPNLIVTRTFSKIHGLAGLRIGYGVSQETIADLMNRVRQPFNTNSLAQSAAIAALDDSGHVQQTIKMNLDGIRQLQSGFSAMGLSSIPTVANFITVHLGGRPGVDVYNSLLHQGIIVRPVDNYGLPEYLRITVGTGEQNFRVLEGLQKALSN